MEIDGGKIKKPYQELGPEVKVRVKELENDTWAQTTLKEIGKSMAEPGFGYIGSAALHFYSTSDTLSLAVHEGAIKHQFALGDLSEEFARFGTTEFVKAIARYFGHEQKTNDPNYKVETK